MDCIRRLFGTEERQVVEDGDGGCLLTDDPDEAYYDGIIKEIVLSGALYDVVRTCRIARKTWRRCI